MATLWLVGLVVFLAGLSEGLGRQGLVLLINRITPLRFALNLLLSAVLYALSALLWVFILWGVARVLFQVAAPLELAIVAVGLAYVPLLFSAVGLLPYVGIALDWLLHIASLAVSLLAMRAAFGLSLWQAFVCAALGWLVLELLRALLGESSARLSRWLWAMTTGRPERIERSDLPLVIPGYEPPGERAAR